MLMVSAAAFGQTNFKFGVTGGLNVSKEHVPNLNFNHDSRVGFSLGVVGELSFSNNFYGNSSILFSTKGFENKLADGEDDSKDNLNYLEIPIHFGYKYSITNNISVLGECGPYFGYLLSAKGIDEGYKWNGTEDFNKVDFGVGFNVGVEFINRFRVTVGYDWGLSNINKNSDSFDFGKANNRNFGVKMAFFF